MGKKEGYLLIINKFGVIYSPNSIDVTDKVIGKLNTKFAIKKK
jgi:Skp family chaperone for outer membrane proteins